MFGSLPLIFSTIEISVTDAVFETFSALTTTGSTVLVGLDTMAPGLLLWRSLLQWFGGVSPHRVVVTRYRGQSVAQAMANAGPGLGPIVGPATNFAAIPEPTKWLLCLAMLLGRLELTTFYVLLMPDFWRR